MTAPSRYPAQTDTGVHRYNRRKASPPKRKPKPWSSLSRPAKKRTHHPGRTSFASTVIRSLRNPRPLRRTVPVDTRRGKPLEMRKVVRRDSFVMVSRPTEDLRGSKRRGADRRLASSRNRTRKRGTQAMADGVVKTLASNPADKATHRNACARTLGLPELCLMIMEYLGDRYLRNCIVAGGPFEATVRGSSSLSRGFCLNHDAAGNGFQHNPFLFREHILCNHTWIRGACVCDPLGFESVEWSWAGVGTVPTMEIRYAA
ncbi:hypothetical protein M409DRAFT_53968 [Zasmidium cellare ATCC 36951]|uniref:Uncharacterized protein n=1 Tax=Zasmidium cellare ATCC 36951 TaxID=1080233 RepID=A0A6A6CN66_ZASCE|nr:uncharacterized protein M409DRAFT_53968 [Zasmidium cellare ATCC 36951]KAF2167362.1 hypothetical protein M409DRAFT_53968 [Zasmidium cellare ATCC 36951]